MTTVAVRGWLLDTPQDLVWMDPVGVATVATPWSGVVACTDQPFAVAGARLDEDLVVPLPQADGTFAAVTFRPATIDDWNAALAAHQRRWQADAAAAEQARKAKAREDFAAGCVLVVLGIAQFAGLWWGATIFRNTTVGAVFDWALGLEVLAGGIAFFVAYCIAAGSNGGATTAGSGTSPIVAGMAGFALGEYVAHHQHHG